MHFQLDTQAGSNKPVIVGDDDPIWFAIGHIFSRCSSFSLTSNMRLLAVMATFFLLLATPLLAKSPVVGLDGPRAPESLQGHIDYFLEPAGELKPADILALPEAAFSPVTTVSPDFGYTDSTIWLRLSAINTTQDVRSWRIHFRENFKQLLEVHVLSAAGAIKTTYDVGLGDTFHKRPIAYPEMVAPLNLPPGETATILIKYWSQGSSHLAFGFETETSFAARAAARSAKNFLYYGMMIIPLLLASLALAIYRHPVFAAYIGSWLAALLFVMHSDGVTFQYFWPNAPAWNSFASIPLGAGVIILSPNFARVFLNTKVNHPIIDKLLWGVMGLAFAMVVSSAFLDNQTLKKLLVLLSLISVGMCAFSGFVAALTRFKEVRFFVIAWVGFLFAASIMSLRHWIGLEISQDFQNDVIRTVMVVDASLMGLSIADRYNQLRLSRQAAINRRYAEENRNLKLLARLSDLERRFAQESEQLRSRDVASANTLHDLQQPLAALRLSVRALSNNAEQTPIAIDEMEKSFFYIEGLMNAASQQRENKVTLKALEAEEADDATSRFALRKVADSVMQMFLPDATAKGLDLCYFPSRHDTIVSSMEAMRILSNLLSNAIKYTDNGRILFCVRKRGEKLRVEIHDTGRGLSRAEFLKAKERSTRLFQTAEGKDGAGLGLAIVDELARSTGYEVNLLCERSGGLSIGVSFPLAKG